jgi:hypothetical protein
LIDVKARAELQYVPAGEKAVCDGEWIKKLMQKRRMT